MLQDDHDMGEMAMYVSNLQSSCTGVQKSFILCGIAVYITLNDFIFLYQHVY